MKNLIFLSIVSMMVLTSCGKSEQEQVVINHVKGTLKNPDSFQLDSIKMTDTLKVSDIKLVEINLHMEVYDELFEEYKDMSRYDYLYSYQEKSNKLQMCGKVLDDVEILQNQYTKLKDSKEDTLIAYGYKVNYKGTNSYNAVLAEQTTIYVNQKNEIINPINLIEI